MRKNVGFLLMVGISTLGLSGCLLHRSAGPCYGVGCPTFTSSEHPKVADVPKSPNGNASSSTITAAEPNFTATPQANSSPAEANQGSAEQAKPGKFTRMLSALHLHSKP